MYPVGSGSFSSSALGEWEPIHLWSSFSSKIRPESLKEVLKGKIATRCSHEGTWNDGIRAEGDPRSSMVQVFHYSKAIPDTATGFIIRASTYFGHQYIELLCRYHPIPYAGEYFSLRRNHAELLAKTRSSNLSAGPGNVDQAVGSVDGLCVPFFVLHHRSSMFR